MTSALLLSCVKIFFCRIMDVTLGTIRTMLTVKEKSLYAALIGFCEVFIWYVVVKDALSVEGSVVPIAIAYAGGYATGTYIGGLLGRKLIKGNVIVRAITARKDDDMLKAIRDAGYAITVFDAKKSEYGDEKYMILSCIPKKELHKYEELVSGLDPAVFIMVEESKSSLGGYSGQK